MKIAIIGSGISGLSLYLFLEKLGLTKEHSVLMYDARDATGRKSEPESSPESYGGSTIGASIGLSTTGLKVLKRLDDKLYEEILGIGHVLRRCKISTARGWTLADVPVGAADEIMLMIGRNAFWQCLRKRVPERVILRKKVTQIAMHHSNLPSNIVFKDGGQVEADLIVGADGIWSAVRQAMLNGQGIPTTYEYAPQYEGLVGVGGFVPSLKLHDVPEGEMNIVFGGNGFFGYTHTEAFAPEVLRNERLAMWWSTYTLDSCPEDWRDIDQEDVKAQLQERHRGWHNMTIQSILRNVEVNSLYPTFVTPLLPYWNKNDCVLIGDAAHALQPSSGQGASMALEDSETLALLLEHFLRNDAEFGHRQAIDLYSQIRMPRLEMVHRKAQEVGSMKQDMNPVQEMMMYFFIWLINALGLNESYNRRLNDYDVPQQVKHHLHMDA